MAPLQSAKALALHQLYYNEKYPFLKLHFNLNVQKSLVKITRTKYSSRIVSWTVEIWPLLLGALSIFFLTIAAPSAILNCKIKKQCPPLYECQIFAWVALSVVVTMLMLAHYILFVKNLGDVSFFTWELGTFWKMLRVQGKNKLNVTHVQVRMKFFLE